MATYLIPGVGLVEGSGATLLIPGAGLVEFPSEATGNPWYYFAQQGDEDERTVLICS